MTDIHTHILPGMDDGARDIKEALSLLRALHSGGTTAAALTPHFWMQRDRIDKFIVKRDKAFLRLTEAAKDIPVKLYPGAEVTFFADMLDRDLEALCIGGTNALLIELPASHYPPSAQKVFYGLKLKGFVPIAAHIERYQYILREPAILDDLILCGALMQINADSLFSSGKMRKRLLGLIESKRIHFIASDTHSMKRRPPMLDRAMELVNKKLGADVSEALNSYLEF